MRQRNNIITDADWVEDLRAPIEKRAQLLRNEISNRNKALEKAPAGSLRVRKYGNVYQYFHITTPNDTEGNYIKKNNSKLAAQLSQKFYDKKFVSEAKKELSILEEYLCKTKEDSIEEIYTKLHDGKKMLVKPIFEEKDSFVKKWEAVEYEPGYFMEGEAVHYTAKGERVRSKSEENIANMLKMYKVPYRYEYPLILDDVERRPDFTCLNVRTRKEFIWEHFGKMDDEGYALKNVDRMHRYIYSGYFPGENFIMTFETLKSPLSTTIIKRMIERYLL